MHQSTMRVFGLAAALLAATVPAVDVNCGAVDALWQDKVAVIGNYPECESFYDNTNPEQTVNISPDHPEIHQLAACRRDKDPVGFKCPGPGKRDEFEARTDPIIACRRGIAPIGFKCPAVGKRDDSLLDVLDDDGACKGPDCPPAGGIGNKPPVYQFVEGESKEKREKTEKSGNWPPSKRGNWPPAEKLVEERETSHEQRDRNGNWPPAEKLVEERETSHEQRDRNGNWPPAENLVEERETSHEQRDINGNWPPRVKFVEESEDGNEDYGADDDSSASVESRREQPVGGLKDPGHAGNQ